MFVTFRQVEVRIKRLSVTSHDKIQAQLSALSAKANSWPSVIKRGGRLLDDERQERASDHLEKTDWQWYMRARILSSLLDMKYVVFGVKIPLVEDWTTPRAWRALVLR